MGCDRGWGGVVPWWWAYCVAADGLCGTLGDGVCCLVPFRRLGALPLGLFVDSVRDQPRIGHTGGSFGFTTADEFFPKQNLRIIAFTNVSADPEPGEMITNAVFDDLFPEIAAAARKAADGERAEITTQAKALFEELQRGHGEYPTLGSKLAAKMKSGLAERLAGRFSPFGSPTRFIYKGARSEGNLHWHDYLIEFGPGSQLKFSIGLDEAAKIASISYG